MTDDKNIIDFKEVDTEGKEILDDENKEVVMNFIRTEWAEKLVIIVCHGIMKRYDEVTYFGA